MCRREVMTRHAPWPMADRAQSVILRAFSEALRNQVVPPS